MAVRLSYIKYAWCIKVNHIPLIFLEREMFQTKLLEKITTHFWFIKSFFPKIVPFMRYYFFKF